MPSKYLNRNFKPNTFHHIFNRGSFKKKIFKKTKDYQVFEDILKHYLLFANLKSLTKTSDLQKINARKTSTKKPYILIAYCLMPNHFHLLLLQKESSPTITDLIKKISVTYAMYFQRQYQHSGRLFESRFKSIKVFSNRQLLYLTKYIHLNPTKKTVGSHPTDYPYSSLPDYLQLNKRPKDWLNTKIIYNKFFSKSLNPQQEYQTYLLKEKSLNISPKILNNITLD